MYNTIVKLANYIPEEIGWTLVGFMACICLLMACKLGKLFLQMWKEWHETDDEI